MNKPRVKKRFTSEVNVIDLQTRTTQKKPKVTLRPRSKRQEAYIQNLQDDSKNIVFAIGPAGTGKTLIAVQYGIKLLQEGVVDRIIITRPAVSVDEDIGFLPGTLNEKMAPWTRPIFDVLGEYYQKKDIETMLYDEVIEISPLAMMRGRTFKNACIIADECQLCTPNQMKMLLTRIGENSKLIVTGDLEQSDRGQDNGLRDFLERYNPKSGSRISIVRFEQQDVERHPVVKEILDTYKDKN